MDEKLLRQSCLTEALRLPGGNDMREAMRMAEEMFNFISTGARKQTYDELAHLREYGVNRPVSA